jgi:hypothetical protein
VGLDRDLTHHVRGLDEFDLRRLDIFVTGLLDARTGTGFGVPSCGPFGTVSVNMTLVESLVAFTFCPSCEWKSWNRTQTAPIGTIRGGTSTTATAFERSSFG